MECIRPHILTPASAAALFFAALPKVQREERVFVLPLDGNGRVLSKPILVSVGHEDGTAAIDAGTIFREALKAGAEEIIVAHNHPSGDLTPSQADIAATKKLREAGVLLSIPLLEHLILGKAAAGDGGSPAFMSLAEQEKVVAAVEAQEAAIAAAKGTLAGAAARKSAILAKHGIVQ